MYNSSVVADTIKDLYKMHHVSTDRNRERMMLFVYMKRLTQGEFLRRAKLHNGDTYSFDKSIYIDYETKVIVSCHRHGDRLIRPDHLFKPYRCNDCFYESKRVGLGTLKIPDGSKVILLTKGDFALVDESDYECLNKFRWVSDQSGNYTYAVRTSYKNGVKKKIKMHRLIMDVSDKNIFVDHINHNTLDNRRCNLRLCTRQENSRNSTSRKNTTSKYLGVHLDTKKNKWKAMIKESPKKRDLIIGYFDCEIEAAKAYDAKAKELFGEFANPNF